MRQKWQTTSKEDKVAAIAGLASQGYSAAQIAAELEAPSRNAIIGLANRNGIRLHGTAKRRHDPDARGRVVNLPAAKTAVNKGRTPTGTAEVIQLKPKAKKKAPERKASPVKMMDVTNATCRRPLFKDPRGLHPDDMFFCGEVTAEESVWCKAERKSTLLNYSH